MKSSIIEVDSRRKTVFFHYVTTCLHYSVNKFICIFFILYSTHICNLILFLYPQQTAKVTTKRTFCLLSQRGSNMERWDLKPHFTFNFCVSHYIYSSLYFFFKLNVFQVSKGKKMVLLVFLVGNTGFLAAFIKAIASV